MRVLFLSAWFPDPPWNGSRQRVRALLDALAPRHEVTLLSFADDPSADAEAPALRERCERVEVIPLPRFDATSWSSRWAWLSPRPRSIVATFSPAMAVAIRRVIASARYDAVVASQLTCAAYAPWFAPLPALFEELELGALHGQIAAAGGLHRWRAQLMWAKYRRYLRALLPRFRACTVVSDAERQLAASVCDGGGAIHVLPNGVTCTDGTLGVSRQADTVIFTGALRYAPNHEGMRWFLAEVWPRVHRARPAARLLITGAHDDLPLPAGANVVRTGVLPDLRPTLAAAEVAIAPIRSGGGTRVKILDAMAAGTPVVSTSKGAEGLHAIPGEHILIADDATAFADRVVAVLGDAALGDRLARAGRALIATHYDWAVLGPRFEQLVRSLVPE